MIKTIRTSVNTSSWGGASLVPPGIVAFRRAATIQVNVLDAFLTLARVTRPPGIMGFTLSDVWAWMRYIPALAPSADLRLRSEWQELDSHQKMILSDDFGVGFGLLAIHHAVGITNVADTRFVVSHIRRGQFALGSSSRRGPRKAPDFFFIDGSGNAGVIECKGSQSSRGALKKAMTTGVPQKRNVISVKGPQLIHQLVVGVFVPQYQSGESAVISLRDPELSEAARAIEGLSNDELELAVRNMSVASWLSLAGFGYTASYLAASYKEISRDPLIATIRRDLSSSREKLGIQSGDYVRTTESSYIDEATDYRGRRLIFRVSSSPGFENAVAEMLVTGKKSPFESVSEDGFALHRSLGIEVSLSLE